MRRECDFRAFAVQIKLNMRFLIHAKANIREDVLEDSYKRSNNSSFAEKWRRSLLVVGPILTRSFLSFVIISAPEFNVVRDFRGDGFISLLAYESVASIFLG
jgi:hypothetical protein